MIAAILSGLLDAALVALGIATVCTLASWVRDLKNEGRDP